MIQSFGSPAAMRYAPHIVVVVVLALLVSLGGSPKQAIRMRDPLTNVQITNPFKLDTARYVAYSSDPFKTSADSLSALVVWAQSKLTVAEAAQDITPRPLVISNGLDPYDYRSQPYMSKETYKAIFVEQGAPPAVVAELDSMYDSIVAEGVNPAFELLHAVLETNVGQAGTGRVGQKNLHGIDCNSWDNGTCTMGRSSVYASYTDGTRAWAKLMNKPWFFGAGLTTIDTIIPKYAPPTENDTARYIANAKRLIDTWRARDGYTSSSTTLPPIAPQNGAQVAQGAFWKVSAPISTTSGDFGFNINAALRANGGALKHIVIEPGKTFSFNATMGNPANISYRTVSGVPGGGWCDLAARYVQAVRPLLASKDIVFEHHGIQLANVAWRDSVAIWNIGGGSGSAGAAQDLEIYNSSPFTIHLEVIDNGDGTVSIGSRVSS